MHITEEPKTDQKPWQSLKNGLASVKLTIFLMSLTALTVLLGAWCPQESQTGKDKVVETFGAESAKILTQLGITDIYHSPFFLSLIAMLTVNMIACSFLRVFPRVKLLSKPLPFLTGKDIVKLPFNTSIPITRNDSSLLAAVAVKLSKKGFNVKTSDEKILGEYGKYGRLAATVTHIGLLSLLVGVTITSWTGFNGFQPVLLDNHLDFQESEHSKLWVGKLPSWSVRVDATHREDHPSGDPKQWFSTLSVIDKSGKVVKTQEISVNNPLTYEGVDIYQSSWGLDHVVLNFNGSEKRLDLRPMGKLYAAFLPLDQETMMVFSIRSDGSPIKVFAKRPDWEAPRLLTQLTKDKAAKLGPVTIELKKLVPITGLQYKCDPGLPVTYFAFAFIIAGVLMAAIPHRHFWISLDRQDDGNTLFMGGRSVKDKVGFERMVKRMASELEAEFGDRELREKMEIIASEKLASELPTSEAASAEKISSDLSVKVQPKQELATAAKGDSAKDFQGDK